ncbi:MAG TPA: DUF2231 domain-containing protein [Gaiellaceae bacterium]|nr:DUF2231 domain-containing protein [Gaiellaceae bacterium]
MAELKPSYLIHGLPGHPVHPPLTDVTIGAYTFAAIAGLLSKLGVAEHGLAQAWWLALIVALCSTVLTALTGFFDWLLITWGSDLWKTATLHAIANLTAGVLFLLAAVFGHGGYVRHAVTTGSFVLTLVGFATLALGGWLGGKLVFKYGMRVETDDAA